MAQFGLTIVSPFGQKTREYHQVCFPVQYPALRERRQVLLNDRFRFWSERALNNLTLLPWTNGGLEDPAERRGVHFAANHKFLEGEPVESGFEVFPSKVLVVSELVILPELEDQFRHVCGQVSQCCREVGVESANV